jgi:hypothetical protein
MFRRLDSIDMARQEFVDLKAQYQSGVQVFRCSEAQSTHLVRAVAADDDHLPGDVVGVDNYGGSELRGWVRASNCAASK